MNTRHLAQWGVVGFVLVAVTVTVGSCTSSYVHPGETALVWPDPHGALAYTQEPERFDADHLADEQVYLTKGDIVSLQLSSTFVRMAETPGAQDMIVYAEIWDQEPDDRQRLVRVVYRDDDQAAGVALNQRDRLAFGPIVYSGNPLRVKLYVVALKARADAGLRSVMREIGRVASSLGSGAAPFVPSFVGLGEVFSALDRDDRELVFDFTLHPRTMSAGPFLRSGSLALIKRELPARVADARPADRSSRRDPGATVTDASGHAIAGVDEDYPDEFVYWQQPDSPFNVRDGMRPRTRLRVVDGGLFVECVAVDRLDDGRSILAKEGYAATSPLAAPGWITLSSNERVWVDEGAVPDTAKWNISMETALPAAEAAAGAQVDAPTTRRVSLRDRTPDASFPQLQLGRRIRYREKTHAVLTVVRGGDPSDRDLFVTLSAADQETLDKSLQAPSAVAFTRIAQTVGDICVRPRRFAAMVTAVNRSSGASGSRAARVAGSFPAAYAHRATRVRWSPDPAQVAPSARDRRMDNEIIIEILNSLVTGFPYSLDDATNDTKMEALAALAEASFTPVPLADGRGSGVFRFKKPQ